MLRKLQALVVKFHQAAIIHQQEATLLVELLVIRLRILSLKPKLQSLLNWDLKEMQLYKLFNYSPPSTVLLLLLLPFSLLFPPWPLQEP